MQGDKLLPISLGILEEEKNMAIENLAYYPATSDGGIL